MERADSTKLSSDLHMQAYTQARPYPVDRRALVRPDCGLVDKSVRRVKCASEAGVGEDGTD